MNNLLEALSSADRIRGSKVEVHRATDDGD